MLRATPEPSASHAPLYPHNPLQGRNGAGTLFVWLRTRPVRGEETEGREAELGVPGTSTGEAQPLTAPRCRRTRLVGTACRNTHMRAHAEFSTRKTLLHHHRKPGLRSNVSGGPFRGSGGYAGIRPSQCHGTHPPSHGG